MPTNSKEHWETVYSSKGPNTVSWFQKHAELSRRRIRATGMPTDASIINVGGGASTLIDDLLTDGFRNVTVLDLFAAALASARRRLGPAASTFCWREADITQTVLPTHAYDVWHDRAVFHFLTTPAARAAYVDNVRRSVKPGGMSSSPPSALTGPTRCSGLPVCRYDAVTLATELGSDFTLVESLFNVHRTPGGASQQFLYCRFHLERPKAHAV